jgi:cell shape-determining protein MreC
MADIVERLRSVAVGDQWASQTESESLCSEAADEIERLRKELRYAIHDEHDIKVQYDEIERLRAALREISDMPSHAMGWRGHAARALESAND